MFKFQSVADCQQRLVGSLILVNHRPFYVEEAKSNTHVRGYDTMNRDKMELIDLSANCVGSPKVGYYNTAERAIYVTRKPVRRIRQGVCRENLTSSRGGVSQETLCSKMFAQMILDVYPTLEEAYTNTVVKGRAYAIAFSREFAVTKDRELMYTDQLVGRFGEGMTVSFNGKFSCLKELYESASKRPSA